MDINFRNLLFIAMAALVTRPAVAEGVAPTDCLVVSSSARRINIRVMEVNTRISWPCRPELLAENATASLSINGQIVGAPRAFDAETGLVVTSLMPAKLPMDVCVTIEGHDDSTTTHLIERECMLVTSTFLPLPQPRIGLGEMSVVPRF